MNKNIIKTMSWSVYYIKKDVFNIFSLCACPNRSDFINDTLLK